MCRVANHQTMLPRATSSLALNASRDGASTISLGNLFHCVTTLCFSSFLRRKNFLLISNLNLRCLNLRPFPLILSQATTYCPGAGWEAGLDVRSLTSSMRNSGCGSDWCCEPWPAGKHPREELLNLQC